MLVADHHRDHCILFDIINEAIMNSGHRKAILSTKPRNMGRIIMDAILIEFRLSNMDREGDFCLSRS
jgi:GH35 family endo-1,4-beta-xylanase